MSDDDGSFTAGTVVNKVFIDAAYDQIDDQAHSTTNPTVKPKAITDEVVAARGSKASLDARLDVSLNEDGTPKTQASAVSVGTVSTLSFRNLVPNGDFLLWARGDAAAPDYWFIEGAGAAVARTGTGLGDTTRPGKFGEFAAKLTFGSATARLRHQILNVAAFARVDNLKGRKICALVWAQTSTANIARLVTDDGVTVVDSTFHTGSGLPEMLTVTHTINAGATRLDVYVEVAATGNAHFQDVCVVIADLPPDDFIPCETQKGVIHFPVAGLQSTGTKKGVFAPDQPGIVTDVQLRLEGAPAGSSFIVDVNTWDGSAFTSMFSTRPTIADGGNQGNAAPDTTYARRCFRPLNKSTLATNELLSMDIDQVGSGTVGSDLIVEVRVRQYVRVLEAYLDYNNINEA